MFNMSFFIQLKVNLKKGRVTIWRIALINIFYIRQRKLQYIAKLWGYKQKSLTKERCALCPIHHLFQIYYHLSCS